MRKCCPQCGQTMPPKSLPIKLSPRREHIVEIVRHAGPYGIDSDALFDRVYGADPNGGPESGFTALHSMIHFINKQLRAINKVIRAAPTGRCGGRSTYVFYDL